MKLKAFLALLLSFCVVLVALAQTKTTVPAPPQNPSDDKDDVVKITTNLVQVDAAVTKDGKPVTNLTADDFEIYEDGRKQTITSFAYISNVSRTAPPATREKSTDVVPFASVKPNEPRRIMALVVDDLGLSADSIYQTKRQLRKFIAEQLQPNDLVAVMRTSGESGALQQFTNDKRLLNRAVDQLRWNLCSRVGVSVMPFLLAPALGKRDDWNNCGGTSFYQTMKSLRFILDAMGRLPGRKSMVLFSDSLPRETQEVRFDDDDSSPSPLVDQTNYSALLQRIAEKAIRSSVVIYSIDTQGLQYTGPTAADHISGTRDAINRQINDVLAARSQLLYSRREGGELIARQTGGFQIRNSNSFQLDRILEDQSGYYLLGYRPTEETFNRRFHQIKAKVKRSGMTLRTRFGFMGISEEEAKQNQASPRDKVELALISPFGAQDIELDLTSFFVSDKTAGSVVRSFVYISAKDMTFTPVNDRREGSIELHGVIFGDNGAVIEQLARRANLSLSESDYEQALQNGMSVIFDIPVKRPGAYQVRVVVRDPKSSQVGSVGQFVSVPNLNNRRPAVSGIVLGTVATDANEAIANPSARRFSPNDNLFFAYMIYNAAQLGNPAMQVELFHDAKKVYSSPEVQIQNANQPDPNRVFVSGSLRLNADLEPGSYYLEIVIADKNAKDKTAPLMQWVEFQIAK
ncbi:MAG TPA: VWA domain-containing protein [Pyrinomonadaceae bacterium]|nr:VWA domain-containing protein [Pyrinomonadaceae bacterium]